MIKSSGRHLAALMLAVMVLALLLALVALPASANPGLTVSNAILVTDVSPGQALTRKMTVSIGNTDRATDITVQVMGMAQFPDGAFGALAASQDTSPYSARQFITVDKSSFHLEPGGSQDVTATIQVPQDVGAGGRYAIINMATQATPGGAGISYIAAVNVPIYLTVKGSQLVHTGKVTAVAAEEPVSGQPINISTTFQNTGNHNFKVKGELTVNNTQGQNLDTFSTPVTDSSILPGMTRQLKANYIPKCTLAPGNYTIISKVMLENGSLLDESSTTLEVKTTYVPPQTATQKWVMPVAIAAGVIVVVFLTIVLSSRVRRRR